MFDRRKGKGKFTDLKEDTRGRYEDVESISHRIVFPKRHSEFSETDCGEHTLRMPRRGFRDDSHSEKEDKGSCREGNTTKVRATTEKSEKKHRDRFTSGEFRERRERSDCMDSESCDNIADARLLSTRKRSNKNVEEIERNPFKGKGMPESWRTVDRKKGTLK